MGKVDLLSAVGADLRAAKMAVAAVDCISGQKAFDNPRSALCVVLMLVKKPSNLLFQLELTSRVGQ
jgi:hypothetical protein